MHLVSLRCANRSACLCVRTTYTHSCARTFLVLVEGWISLWAYLHSLMVFQQCHTACHTWNRVAVVLSHNILEFSAMYSTTVHFIAVARSVMDIYEFWSALLHATQYTNTAVAYLWRQCRREGYEHTCTTQYVTKQQSACMCGCVCVCVLSTIFYHKSKCTKNSSSGITISEKNY